MGVDQQCSPFPESIARKDRHKHAGSYLTPKEKSRRRWHHLRSATVALQDSITAGESPLLLPAGEQARLRGSRVKKTS